MIEKEEEGARMEDSREKKSSVEYRKEKTSNILNKFVGRFDGKEELSVVYESD